MRGVGKERTRMTRAVERLERTTSEEWTGLSLVSTVTECIGRWNNCIETRETWNQIPVLETWTSSWTNGKQQVNPFRNVSISERVMLVKNWNDDKGCLKSEFLCNNNNSERFFLTLFGSAAGYMGVELFYIFVKFLKFCIPMPLMMLCCASTMVTSSKMIIEVV